MSFITRTDRGSLLFSRLEFGIFMQEILSVSTTKKEVEWISETLSGYVELEADNKLQEISKKE